MVFIKLQSSSAPKGGQDLDLCSSSWKPSSKDALLATSAMGTSSSSPLEEATVVLQRLEVMSARLGLGLLVLSAFVVLVVCSSCPLVVVVVTKGAAAGCKDSSCSWRRRKSR
jgi:hypothetical protein